jgi:nitrite reductase/ring-hydroxylating ferredoxin subunit/uncharacterized membrane protein
VRQFLNNRSTRSVLRSVAPLAVAERIERAPALDPPVHALADGVVRALPPGRRTDALHGVPLGQPAHPILVRLPLGCWTSALLLEAFGGRRMGRAAAALTAVGVATALPAAATGLADWSALHTHQQRVGLVHGIAQAGATLLFGCSLLARAAARPREGFLLSAGGLGVAIAGGYLGGHLAHRLGAGASHAESVGHLAAIGWQDLCPLSDLPDGRPVRRQLGYLGLVAVRRTGREVRVLSDQCAHLGGPLHQGRVTEVRGEDCVTCPWHGSAFRLADGAVRRGPATARQPAFEARISDTDVVQVRPRLGAPDSGPGGKPGHGAARLAARAPHNPAGSAG